MKLNQSFKLKFANIEEAKSYYDTCPVCQEKLIVDIDNFYCSHPDYHFGIYFKINSKISNILNITPTLNIDRLYIYSNGYSFEYIEFDMVSIWDRMNKHHHISNFDLEKHSFQQIHDLMDTIKNF